MKKGTATTHRPNHAERCSFCYAQFETSAPVVLIGKKKIYHRQCLPAVLEANQIEALRLSGSDKSEEIITGFQLKYPKPLQS